MCRVRLDLLMALFFGSYVLDLDVDGMVICISAADAGVSTIIIRMLYL
jgi:hypothetical protein